MCGGKKKAPAPAPVVPQANPFAVADKSNDMSGQQKLAATTDSQTQTSFGSELGATG
jgi:hypothetical protein